MYQIVTHRFTRLLTVAALALFAAALAQAQEPAGHDFKTSDGYNIKYYTAGDHGSWVVLLHGYRDSARRMYFSTGIAQALAVDHRVLAMDHLNHGQSDKPEAGGVARIQDVLELMDHLGIERAHIHGYSMGGAMTTALLYDHPERFITAGFGGSGFRETDPELAKIASAFDTQAPASENRPRRPPPAPSTTSSAINGEGQANGQQRRGAPGGGLSVYSRPLDLKTVTVPVLAINGEYDNPYAKTQRMWHDLRIFQNVVLPGRTHVSAIGVGASIPKEFIEAMVGFINAYDEAENEG